MADKIVTWEEFGKHIFYYDCWVMIEGNVYNVTDFLVEHPGGDAILIKFIMSYLETADKMQLLVLSVSLTQNSRSVLEMQD